LEDIVANPASLVSLFLICRSFWRRCSASCSGDVPHPETWSGAAVIIVAGVVLTITKRCRSR